VLRTGEPELGPEITDELLEASADNAEHLALMRELGLRSYVIVPLTARGRTFGAITLVTAESGRRYGPGDLEVAEDLARRAALAVDNARLYEEAQREIAERERAEEALKESEERFRSLVQNASDIISILEPDGTIRYESPAIKQVLGYDPEELVGKNAFDYVHPEDVEQVLRLFADSLGEGAETASEEFRFRHADGSWRYLESVGNNLTRDPGIRGVVVNTRDVTERKKAEEEMEGLVEELQRSNAELEQFAYVASHDLQEPLRMVSSYTKLLARRYSGQLDSDADEFIGYAVDGATRMQTLINDLLYYSRVNTRGRPLVPTDANAVFEAARDNLLVATGESGAEVTSGALPTVVGDRTQLVQLFQNLIGNAMKFGVEGRTPEVRVQAERLANAGAGAGEWLFSVRDNGIGIEEQYKERVFVIFQRLHAREDYAGTGIGLAVCKKIVERHGGRIWVESSGVPGEGSTFYFTLRPVREEE
jgi:PAS domain S-box-containing protein